MKIKEYTTPSIQIISFENEDVICTSAADKKVNFTISAEENLGSVDASYFGE